MGWSLNYMKKGGRSPSEKNIFSSTTTIRVVRNLNLEIRSKIKLNIPQIDAIKSITSSII